MPGIVIHTDGSCHGNPGPGGYSAIIQIPPNIQVRGHHPNTTNNQMEMTAVIEGLTRLGQFVGIDGADVEIRTDSEYVCNGFNKGWLAKWQQNGWLTSGKKAVANQELWEELLRLTHGPNVTFTHVQGHAGDPMNRLCDRIANEEAMKAERKRSEGIEGMEGSEGLVRTTVVSPEVPAKIPEASEKTGTSEYTRGYAQGYEAARKDMANALNRLGRHPTPEMPDDLRRNAKFQGIRHEGWEKVTKEILKLTGGEQRNERPEKRLENSRTGGNGVQRQLHRESPANHLGGIPRPPGGERGRTPGTHQPQPPG